MTTLHEIYQQRMRGKDYLTLPETAMKMVVKPDCIDVVYHDTAIVKAFADGRVMLDNGGWRTVSTKKFMARYLPLGWNVKIQAGAWLVVAPDGAEFAYENDMTIWPDRDGDARVAYAWQDVKEEVAAS